MLSIDARASRELQALLFAIKLAPTEVRKQIRGHTKAVVGPEWAKAVQARSRTSLDHKTHGRTATVAVGDRNVTLKAGGKGRLKSGLAVPDIVKQNEFGGNREKFQRYTGRRGGKSFPVNRRTQRQLPPRYRKGRIAYPSAAELIPRLASLWVQTTIRTFHEVLEKR